MQNVMWKKLSKSDPQSSKKSVFGAILASPNPRFFEILAIKMKMVFCNIKMSRNGSKCASQIPPRAKALWPRGPGFWSMVEEVAFSNTPVAQGPANFLKKKIGNIFRSLLFFKSFQKNCPWRANFLKWFRGRVWGGLCPRQESPLPVPCPRRSTYGQWKIQKWAPSVVQT